MKPGRSFNFFFLFFFSRVPVQSTLVFLWVSVFECISTLDVHILCVACDDDQEKAAGSKVAEGFSVADIDQLSG